MTETKPFTIVEAPSVLGLFPKGVETLSDALLAAGLAERLGAGRAGRVEPPPSILIPQTARTDTPGPGRFLPRTRVGR